MISSRQPKVFTARIVAGVFPDDKTASGGIAIFNRLMASTFSSFFFVLINRLAMLELLSAGLFAGPGGRWAGANSVCILLPISILSPVIASQSRRYSSSFNPLLICLIQPLLLATIALACQSLGAWPLAAPLLFIISVAAIALLGEAFCQANVVATGECVPPGNWRSANTLQLLFNVCGTILAFVCFFSLPSQFSLPHLLRSEALAALLSASLLYWSAAGQMKTSSGTGQPTPRRHLSNKRQASQFLRELPVITLWFGLSLSCCLPIFLLFLLALEQQTTLGPTLIDFCDQAGIGCLIGAALANIPLKKGWRLTRRAIPFFLGSLTAAGSLICLVKPSGQNVNTALLLLGMSAAASYIELDTRLQRIFRGDNLRKIVAWRWSVGSLVILAVAFSLAKYLDTISATMLLRVLGALTIFGASSVLIVSLLLISIARAKRKDFARRL